MNMIPKVSIVLAVYNGEEFLNAAIDSVLDQSFTDFEFIIVDDGSTDASEKIITDNDDSRIVSIKNKHQGLVRALNTGLRKSRAELIARIDADDCWEPDKLKNQVSFLNENNAYSMVASGRKYIDSSDKTFVDSFSDVDLDYPTLKDRLGCYNIICHSSVLFKRIIIEQEGIYREKYPYCEDYDYWVRILKKHKAYLLGQPLVRYRIHPKMVSIIRGRKQSVSIIRIKLKFFKEIGFKFKYIRFLALDIARLLAPNYFSEYRTILRRK